MKNLRPLLAAVCCLALFGFGCGDNELLGDPRPIPVPGCEAHDHAPCDVRSTDCQTRLLGVAACLSGEPAGELPPVTIMTESEFAAYLTAEAAKDMPWPHLQELEKGYGLLGLVDPGAFTTASMVAVDAAFIWGRYRSDTKDILIIDHGDQFNRRTGSIILIHELVHALQDRAIDLLAFKKGHATSEDTLRAAVSLVEGEARMHEDRYAASASGYDPSQIDFHRRIQSQIDRLEADLPGAKSPYTKIARQFPYLYGTRYAQFTWAASGHDAVRARYASPPNDTLTLLASKTAALEPRPAPPEMPQPPAPPEWTLIDDTVLGAWGALLFLAHGTYDLAAARLSAERVVADGLWIYASAGGGVTVVWRADFSDVAAASTAASTLLARFSPTEVVRQGASVVVARTNVTGASLGWAFADATAVHNGPAAGGTEGNGAISSGSRPTRRAVRIDTAWPTWAPVPGSTALDF